MFTLTDIAENLGLKLNTLRYWLKKNSEDFENNFYETNLLDLTQRIKIYKQTKSSKNIIRSYEQIIVLDFEEFKEEFFKYTEFIKNSKRKKRLGNLAWTTTAIDCYSCDMICEKCFNHKICAQITKEIGKAPMKETVLKLLNVLGKPYLK